MTWPDPFRLPYKREATILSYNINVYRLIATTPSRTWPSHTVLFHTLEVKAKRLTLWSPWVIVNVPDLQTRGKFSQICSFDFYNVMLQDLRPSMRVSSVLTVRLQISRDFFFINILGRGTSWRLQKHWQI